MKKFRCKKCDKVFKSLSNLVRHNVKKHTVSIDLTPTPKQVAEGKAKAEEVFRKNEESQ
jgi:hypothetical protein